MLVQRGLFLVSVIVAVVVVQETNTTHITECEDRVLNCPSLLTCEDDNMQKNCQKSCGLCEGNISPTLRTRWWNGWRKNRRHRPCKKTGGCSNIFGGFLKAAGGLLKGVLASVTDWFKWGDDTSCKSCGGGDTSCNSCGGGDTSCNPCGRKSGGRECVDKALNCPSLLACEDDNMQTNCQKSCGLCEDSPEKSISLPSARQFFPGPGHLNSNFPSRPSGGSQASASKRPSSGNFPFRGSFNRSPSNKWSFGKQDPQTESGHGGNRRPQPQGIFFPPT